MTQTVLITGAGGYLGGHAIRHFAADGWRVIGAGRSDPEHQARRCTSFHGTDFSDAAEVADLIARSGPDLVIHLAAPSSVAESVDDPLADFTEHVAPTANLLEGIRLSKVPSRVLLVSSAAVYGDPRELPVNEGAPAAPISPYGFHKLHQELLFDQYARIHGVRCCKARVFSTYGEGLRRLAVWDITRRALAGDHTVHGTGDETRDYLYAGDVAAALACIAESAPFAGEAINVASGEEVSVRRLAEKIYAIAGVAGSPLFSGRTFPGNPIHWRADVSQLRRLGFRPQGDWSSGLARTVEWIREHA
jgi:UDP-glucose 4-epimerase